MRLGMALRTLRQASSSALPVRSLTSRGNPTAAALSLVARHLSATMPIRSMSGSHDSHHGHSAAPADPYNSTAGRVPQTRIKSWESQFPENPPDTGAGRIFPNTPTEYGWEAIKLRHRGHERQHNFHYTDSRHPTWERDMTVDTEVKALLANVQPFWEKRGPLLKRMWLPAALYIALHLIFMTTDLMPFFPAANSEGKDKKKDEKKDGKKPAAAAAGSVAASGLDGKDWKPFKLSEIRPYNHNTKMFVFDLASADVTSGLPIASFILTKLPTPDAEGKEVSRPYTPIDTNEPGKLVLLVKNYPQGVMSKYIHELKLGQTLDIKGPIPKLKYAANMKKHIGMIAGGTGITPMLQVIDAVVNNPADKTQVTLVFGNITEDDILLRSRLDELQAKHSNFKVHYVLDKPPADWKGESGYVNETLTKKYMPAAGPDSMVLVCGPPGMVASLAGSKVRNDKTGIWEQGPLGGQLQKLGFNSDNVYKF